MLVVLRSVIQARESCASWYKSNRDMPAGDSTHEHAIKTFKAVLEILEAGSGAVSGYNPDTRTDSSRSVGVMKSSSGTSSTTSVKIIKPTLPNVSINEPPRRYELAQRQEVEKYPGLSKPEGSKEPEALSQQAPAPTIARRNNEVELPEQTFESEDEGDDDYYFMEIIFFLSDVAKMRDYLKQLWQDWCDGIVELLSASMVTSHAFEILQRNELELMQSYEGLEKENTVYQRTAGSIYIRILKHNDFKWMDHTKSEKIYKISDSLFHSTYVILEEYLEVMKPKVLRINAHQNARPIAPSGQDRKKMTPLEKVQEDRDIIWALLPDITSLIGVNVCASKKKPFNPMAIGHRPKPILGSAISSMDFLSQGLFAAQGTKHIPLSLVFAVQILLDVFHITRHDNDRAFNEAAYMATIICGVLDQYSGFSRDMVSAKRDSDPKNGQVLKDIQKFGKDWLLEEDVIGSYARRVSPNTHRDYGKFWLLRHHPQLCGTMMAYMSRELQKAGQKFASSWGCALACIHLYNAATQTGFIKDLWTDVENVIDFHETTRLFSGNVPTKPADFLRKFSVVTGRRLFGGPSAEVSDAFTEGESVAKFLSYRYSDADPNSNNGISAAAQLFHEAVQHILAQARTSYETAHLNASEKVRYLGRNHASPIGEADNLTPVGFLDTLCIAVEYQSESLIFDYMTFHMRCLTLLKDLYQECEAELKVGYGSDDAQREALPQNFGLDEELRNLPYWIFKHDVETGTQTLIWKAARVLTKLVRADGSVGSQTLVDMKRGFRRRWMEERKSES